MTSPDFQCRSCGSAQGSLILDLGLQPLANNLLSSTDLGQAEPKFPLRVAVCERCWLLQILDIVPPVRLFSEYLYFSSFSDALLRHAQKAAETYRNDFGLNENSLVVEVASNDGYLLQNFQKAGVPCLGIEPAKNIARVAQEKGIETLTEFFTADTARKLAASGRQADLIIGNNVFAHAPDTNDFVAGLRTLLKPAGRVVLEFPYAVDLMEHVEFDTIYHEHVFYFTLTALQPLLARHGLAVCDVVRLPIHGGSLRVLAAPHDRFPVQSAVGELLALEQAKGIASLEFYTGFARRVTGIKSSLRTLLDQLKAVGNSIAAYGASAKGATLLNFCGIGSEVIDFVVDRSSYKQGRFTPGTHLPILAAEELARRHPQYTLLLTWNFAEEILAQQKAYRASGGKFIVPVPEVKVL